jgi:hypothetical protein
MRLVAGRVGQVTVERDTPRGSDASLAGKSEGGYKGTEWRD